MEYERHANRLVLGYLKNNCTSAYKSFLKQTFQNQGKHINTRIAGQNLEDILRIYSRVSEIVQGRVEDTNYPIEHGSEKLSPMFLAEQLLYLLDHSQVKHFPRSRRTSIESCVTEFTESHAADNEDFNGHMSDVETTPENSLPGNVNYYSSAKKITGDRTVGSSRRKPTRVEKVVVDKEVLSEVMSEKLLQNTEFQQKLASTITTVLNTPDVHAKKYCHNATYELDSTIKNVLNKTEADPMFEEVLQEFLGGPRVNAPTKEPCDAISTTSSDHFVRNTISTPIYSSGHTDRGSESSDLNETCKIRPNKNNASANEVPVDKISERPEILSTPNPPINTPHRSVVSQSVSATSSTNPIYINSTSGGLFMVPQPYYLINQPITIPSNCQQILMQSGTNHDQNLQITQSDQYCVQNSAVSYQGLTSFDSSGVSNIQAEVNNIQEYLTMYDDTKPSPLVKQQQQQPKRGLKKVIYPKKRANLQPRPTVKVEIMHVIDDKTAQTRKTSSCTKSDKNMPFVGFEHHQDTTINNAAKSNSSNPKISEKNSKSESESKQVSGQKEISSGPKLITPSPSITTVQKRTPKSGSHIRNLTFPSPSKESRMSQSSDAKLCVENDDKPKSSTVSVPLCWDARLRRFVDPIITEEKEEVQKYPPKRKKTPRKLAKATELNVTEIEGKLLEDALKTPKDTKKCSKSKTSSTPKDTKKCSKTKTPSTQQLKKAAEPQLKESENEKKILSPSKLNASKRNLLYEPGSENEMQAKKFLQEDTPLKNFPITPGLRGETPFTPMLQANLKEITGGDIFCIDTPNFPVTPGLSFMANSTNYYIFQDDEKVLAGEIKKSDEEKTFELLSNLENIVDPLKDTIKVEDEFLEENTECKKRKISEVSENKAKKPRLSPKKMLNSKTPSKKTVEKPPPKHHNKSPGSSKSPVKAKKKTKPLENGNVKKRQTRSTVLSKLKNSKPFNSPRNDSDDQCNFFKASGTNLQKLKNKQDTKKQEGTSVNTKNNDTVIEELPQNIIEAADKEAELHMALVSARQDFTICHFNNDFQTYTYNETTSKTSLPYDASILDKKRKVIVFTAQDDEIQIILSATKFNPLLDLGVSSFNNGDIEYLPRERKETGPGEPIGVKNAKRRSRSDSNSSYNSTSSKKKEPALPVNTKFLKDININSFLTHLHGHGPPS